MSNSNKPIELAKKLKALADRGIDGEKQNAISMLHTLMKKHKITMEMITGDEKKDYQFIIPKGSDRFFRQISSSVLGKTHGTVEYTYHPRNKHRMGITCTPAEAIEIEGKFKFYWKAYNDEVDIFYNAFIQKNKLYVKPSQDDDAEQKELTTEEKARLYKMMNMMQGMDRHHYMRQLENKRKDKH